MRTLILTGNATDEQRAIAQSLKAALVARGGSCLVVSALALLGQHAPLSQTTAMEKEALFSPRAFAFLFAGNAFSRKNKRKSIVYTVNATYIENLKTLLREGEFDAVLCLHRYPAEAVTTLRKTLAFSARCCFVATDLAVVPFLEETALDLYFLSHEDFVPPYVRRGLAKKKLVPVGIPIPAAWLSAEERADARALLHLPQNIECYYVSSAADPAAAAAALLSSMNGADARILAPLPESPPARTAAQRQAVDIRLVSVDPDDGPARNRSACDVLLSAPTGAASVAAVLSGVPLVHLPPEDDFERQTAQFFQTRGMSQAANTLSEAASLALTLAKDAESREAMLSAQRGAFVPGAAERIVRYLHEGRI